MSSRHFSRALTRSALAAAFVALVSLAVVQPARAEAPTCPCLGDWPVAAPLLCYDAPGSWLNTFSFTSPPAVFAQVYGLGPLSRCRANGSFRSTTAAEAASCREDLQWQCGCGSPSAEPVHDYDLQTSVDGFHLEAFESGPGRQVQVRFDVKTDASGLHVRVREDRCINGVRDRFLYEIRFHTMHFYIDTGPVGFDADDEIIQTVQLGQSGTSFGSWRHAFNPLLPDQLVSTIRVFAFEVISRLGTGPFQEAGLDWGTGDLKLDYLFSSAGPAGSRIAIVGDQTIDYRTTDFAHPDPRLLPCYVSCGENFGRLGTSESIDVPGHFRDVFTWSLLRTDEDTDCIWD